MHPISNELPYSQFLELRTSEDTRINYAFDLGALRDWKRKKEPAWEVYKATKADLLQYFQRCRSRGVSDTSVKRYMASVKSFLKFIRSDENSVYYRPDNPTEILEQLKLKPYRANPKAPTPDQRQTVLNSLKWNDTIHEWQVSLAVFLSFKTGLRRFEIAKLEWKDIDLTADKLKVVGKGGKHAVLNITKELHEKLSDYYLLVQKIGSPWVFFNRKENSKHLHKTNVARFFRIIRKRCGFSKEVRFSTHSGRHVFCTTLSEKGVKPEVAVKMTRHESIDMYQKYVKVDDELVKDEVNRAIG